MQKIIIGIIIALAIIGVGTLALNFPNQSSNSASTSTAPAPTVETSTATPVASSPSPATPSVIPMTTGGTPSSYTMAEVAKHKDASSCWAAINGKVYDLTKWVSQHPGGPERILGICGKDGSAAFNDQHGGQDRPASELANFYITELAK